MNWIKVCISVLSLLVVLLAVVWEWRRATSPGDLHPAHAAVAELHGSAGCAACHGDSKQDMAAACMDCHKSIAAQLRQATGIHGVLKPQVAKACGACHDEHSGTTGKLVTEKSFQKAGVPDPGQYKHGFIKPFILSGSHAKLECFRCHQHAGSDLIAVGQSRFLGLKQECESCHRDPHKGEYGPDCESCHGQVEAWDRVALFKHSDIFPLTGQHADKACKNCHTPGGPFAVAVLHGRDMLARPGGFKPVLVQALPAAVTKPAATAPREARACVECHRSPHRRGFVKAAQRFTRTPVKDECTVCHLAEHESFVGPTVPMTVAMHEATGFPLIAPHEKVKCEECHKEFGKRKRLPDGPDLAERFAGLFPGREPKACEACHADPHDKQFDKGSSGGRCLACHTETTFKPSKYTVEEHQRTRYPLTGAHQAVACDRCHVKKEGKQRFVNLGARCEDCHEDIHKGKFDGPDRPAVVRGNKGCARCHDTASFTEVKWTGDDHTVWTGYELKGPHAKASCVQCHKPKPKGKPASQPAGPVASGPESRPAAAAMALGASGAVLLAAEFGTASTECDSCHADPHMGQFRRGGASGCERCHTVESPFAKPTFDHNRDSSFALDDTHKTLACAACHRGVRVEPGRVVVRYVPLGTRCQDCHAIKPKRKKVIG